MPRPVALITGPTSGLGEGFARRYAADGYDLVLVAPEADELQRVADKLHQAHGVAGDVLVADLADPEGRAAVARRLADGVQVLVNNAGIGIAGEFWTIDPALLQTQLDVNVTAVMHLTRAALPAMLRAGAGTVINIGSIAGLLPERGSTYSASKAWVVSFSEGLSSGLAGTGVSVHALCPGYMHTNFHRRAGITMSSMPSFMWLNIDDVVDQCLSQATKGTVVIVPGLQYKVLTTGGRMLPRAITRRLTKICGQGQGRT
ncbi:SDR family NAD(P)-dependent oxidoreductase [Mycobacterium sherrisii]|uniref:Short-chain dehydrogenase n=1 Tax=Mycobacterium sherrisii TaxID=243061 RepID=A0A1E3SNE2_9MYCO|nr:SDR family NAD(P)-dependent oxidoreductase [Mycobacterium sherrisii]MCV7027660.1 SDR family NAD(P)-dependent oxidoreductase [Mycobacterium sherrisii]MEC4764828.1 SDR family NAD(P)-dependent oxidoreductase [Mycobacterium sherrisii]ODR03666.1 short-chain dehydrogenase [Mycobacterium sherrisii]ORW72507.1 short-chain dehydrogenase [Mycobacterium sherrisii]